MPNCRPFSAAARGGVLGSTAAVLGSPCERRLLCRFLDAGNKEVPHAQPTGVQKAPRHEVAGSSAPAEQRALRGFVRGARLRKFEEWRPRPRAQLKRYGTIVAK